MAKFNIGDVVEITAEAAATGMLDFVEGKAYRVEDVDYNAKVWCAHEMILLKDESGKKNWYNVGHFKLKENSVESNENHFKVGQTVWDVVYGKGEVVNVLQNVLKYPVVVKFVDGKRHFTEDGKTDENHARTLFFSEPKIIAETKPAFVPALEGGMTLAAVDKETFRFYILVVGEETQEVVESVHLVVFEKELFDFYRLGEKIEFN